MILLYEMVMMMIFSDICGDAAGYIWAPIYQLVLVRGTAAPPNQVNRKLFTEASQPPDYSSAVRTAQVASAHRAHQHQRRGVEERGACTSCE